MENNFIKRFFWIGLLAMVAAMLAAVNSAAAWETFIDEDPFDGITIWHTIEDRNDVAFFEVMETPSPNGASTYEVYLYFYEVKRCAVPNDYIEVRYIFNDEAPDKLTGYGSIAPQDAVLLSINGAEAAVIEFMNQFHKYERLRMRIVDECGNRYDMDFAIMPLPVDAIF